MTAPTNWEKINKMQTNLTNFLFVFLIRQYIVSKIIKTTLNDIVILSSLYFDFTKVQIILKNKKLKKKHKSLIIFFGFIIISIINIPK